MSKSLEQLQIIRNVYHNIYGEDISIDKDLDIIEKDLKTLEIIKEHIMYCENVDCFVFVNITKEVNDLLKKVLNL